MNCNDQKSKRRIRNAYLQLLDQKDFDHISIKDIITAADISRSTFYAHYESKFDVIEEIENNLIEGFTKIMLELRHTGRDAYYKSIEDRDNVYFKEYFYFIQANSTAFRAFLSPKCNTGFSSRFTKAITNTRLETTQVWNLGHPIKHLRTSPQQYYREAALSSIYVALFTSWLNRNMDLSPDEMGRVLATLWGSLLSARWPELFA